MPTINARHDYDQARLDEAAVASDPFRQFQGWFDHASASGLAEPNAMIVATASPGGRPSARVVLMRGYDDRGFPFFTNYRSRKGGEIEANPFASAVFFWHPLERQVRVEGDVVRVSAAESDTYFESRPTGSKRGAWASSQSAVVADRDVLEAEMARLEARFPDDPIPRPPHWGGYRIVPEAVEFWQGRSSRLHDRIVYRRTPEGGWRIERLSP